MRGYGRLCTGVGEGLWPTVCTGVGEGLWLTVHRCGSEEGAHASSNVM